MRLAPTWYLTPTSRLLVTLGDAVEYQPCGGGSSGAPLRSQRSPVCWAVARAKNHAILGLSFPLKRRFDVLTPALHPLEKTVQASTKAQNPAGSAMVWL